MGPSSRDIMAALALPLAILFVFLVTYIPHMQTAQEAKSGGMAPGLAGLGETYVGWFGGDRDDYEYTMHVDENIHWARMAQLQRQETVTYDEPFTGAPATGTLGLKGSTHEVGFHVAMAQFQEISGIPWPLLFRFLPSTLMAVTAWAVWAALAPWRGATLAAALVALVPTSPRFLGPGFLVPAGFGLLWLALVALLARQALDHRRSPVLLVLMVAWSFYIHFVVGAAAALVVLSMMPWVRYPRRSVVLLVTAFVPVLWLLGSFFDELDAEATKLGVLPNDRTIFTQLGALFLLIWLVGVYLLLERPPKRDRSAVLGLSVASAVAFAFIALNLAFHLDSYFLYERWHQPFALFATVPVAYACLELASRSRRWLTRRRATRVVHASVVPLLLLVSLHIGVEGHLRQRYYYLIDDDDWASFSWAQDHLPPQYSTFLTHPWKAPVLTAMTGRHPVTWLYPGVLPVNGQVFDAYRAGGHGDAVYLVENDVTWISDPLAPQAPEYEPIGVRAYGLRSPYIDDYNRAVGWT